MKVVTILSCIFFLFFFYLPLTVQASILINEFSSATVYDWVEIYNPDDVEYDLNNYHLQDRKGNELKLNGTIAPRGIAVFEWFNRLDKLGDTLRLLQIGNATPLDEVSYGEGSSLPAAIDPQTIGRKTDGAQEWVLFATNTKGSSNDV